MFENIKIGEGMPGKGKLLIAEPFLADPNFKRSVVVLTEHTEEGVVGFILNKMVHEKISEAIMDFPDFDAPIFLGGPVQPDTLHYIHKVPDLLEGSMEIVEGIYWGGNFESLKIQIEAGAFDPKDIRFFMGYAGWDADQLKEELEQKSWIITDAAGKYIFHPDPDNKLWKDVLHDMGKDYEMLSNFPENPMLN